VAAHLGLVGVSVVASGKLDASEIDAKHLIDTHYGAIAKKVLKPVSRFLLINCFAGGQS